MSNLRGEPGPDYSASETQKSSVQILCQKRTGGAVTGDENFFFGAGGSNVEQGAFLLVVVAAYQRVVRLSIAAI